MIVSHLNGLTTLDTVDRMNAVTSSGIHRANGVTPLIDMMKSILRKAGFSVTHGKSVNERTSKEEA